jgi:hypothetical protein
VALAIKRWNLRSYKPEVIGQLGLIVARLRVDEAIPSLRVGLIELVDSIDALGGFPPPGREPKPELKRLRNATEDVIVGLGAFASDGMVTGLFHNLFSDDTYALFAAQFLTGLCAADPDNYWTFLPRFHALVERHRPQNGGDPFYNERFILREMARSMGLATIFKHLGDLKHLSRNVSNWFESILFLPPDPVAWPQPISGQTAFAMVSAEPKAPRVELQTVTEDGRRLIDMIIDTVFGGMDKTVPLPSTVGYGDQLDEATTVAAEVRRGTDTVEPSESTPGPNHA